MRVVVTGQVGLDKKPFLSRVVELAQAEGLDPAVASVGQMMYREAPDVAPGRILDLPLSRLNGLRRSVFKDVLAMCQAKRDVIVNTHATFRWRHGLFYAFDYDQMKQLDADLYVVLVDNVDRVHWRLARDGHTDHTLKDLMVWREEEMLATELLGQIVRGHGRFYIIARTADDSGAEALARLVFRPQFKKVYLSYPMTHLRGEGASGRRPKSKTCGGRPSGVSRASTPATSRKSTSAGWRWIPRPPACAAWRSDPRAKRRRWRFRSLWTSWRTSTGRFMRGTSSSSTSRT